MSEKKIILVLCTSFISCATLDVGSGHDAELEKYTEPENFDMSAALATSQSESQPSSTSKSATFEVQLGTHILQSVLCGVIVGAIDIFGMMLLCNSWSSIFALPIVFLLAPTIGSVLSTLMIYSVGYIEKPLSLPSIVVANISQVLAFASAVAGGVLLFSHDYWPKNEMYMIVGVSYILPSALFAATGTAITYHMVEE